VEDSVKTIKSKYSLKSQKSMKVNNQLIDKASKELLLKRSELQIKSTQATETRS